MNKKIPVAASLGAAIAIFGITSYAQELIVGVKPTAKNSNSKSSGTTKGMEVEREKLDLAEEQGRIWFESQPFKELYMTNARGEKLCAYYLPPKEGSNVLAFVCHGYKSNAHRNPMLFARYYHETLGYGLFFMDHVASGKSEGHYVGFSGYESDDCLAWINYINANLNNFQIIIHGVSMGGATVAQMTGKDLPENVKFCIDDCGFTGGAQQMAFELDIRNIPRHPLIELFGFVNWIKTGYALKYSSAIDRIRNAKVPILFFHGDKDGFVPLYMGQEMYDACPTDKELVIIPNATHAACVLYDTDLYWSKVSEFANKYLD